jgi:hypothetical protein
MFLSALVVKFSSFGVNSVHDNSVVNLIFNSLGNFSPKVQTKVALCFSYFRRIQAVIHRDEEFSSFKPMAVPRQFCINDTGAQSWLHSLEQCRY